VGAALRRLAGRPLFVVATGRPEVEDFFPDLFRSHDVQKLRLAELRRRAAEELVRSVLGNALDPALVSTLAERSGGNAFFLEELIRAFDLQNAASSETVLAMVQARLEALDPAARRVLRAASVFGPELFQGGVWALVGEGASLDVAGTLDLLVEREVLVRHEESRFPREVEYRFRHAHVREAAYAMLTDEDRVLGHRLAAGWLTSAGERDPALLAEHHERGGQPERAVAGWIVAAGQALAGNDFAGAIAFAERGVTCGATGASLGRLRRLQAEASVWRAGFADAIRYAEEALEHLVRGSEEWLTAAGDLAVAAGKIDDGARLAAVATELGAIEATDENVDAYAIAVTRVLYQFVLKGQTGTFPGLARSAEALAGRVRDPTALAFLDVLLARQAEIDGQLMRHLELRREIVSLYEQAGDLRRTCLAQINVAFTMHRVGQHEEAERLNREALASARRLGLGSVGPTAAQNLGILLALRGRIEEAEPLLRDACAELEGMGEVRLTAASRCYLARLHWMKGDATAAEAEARRALGAAEAARQYHPYAWAVISLACSLDGRTNEALDAAAEARRALERVGAVDEGEMLIALAAVEALEAAGRPQEAAAEREAARGVLRQRADQIPDPTLREGFLRSLPEHVALLDG
jgi:tetratricopeptide (TPR) repeat protein